MNKVELIKAFEDWTGSEWQYADALSEHFGVDTVVGDITFGLVSDPYFCGSVRKNAGQGIDQDLIIIGSAAAETVWLLGAVGHEVTHIKSPAAFVPGLIKSQDDANLAHWSPIALRFEEQADFGSCMMGYADELLLYLEFYKERAQESGITYTGDADDRIARIKNWQKTGVWLDNGLDRLPTYAEIRKAAVAAGADLFVIAAQPGMAGILEGATPDELRNGGTVLELGPETQKWLEEVEAKHR